ncbi:MAG: hypothetical protein H6513_00845 [Acidimicrobiaceae bacterium]|nr:hypothetical protein [Ilumatobacter sp.]MCB9379217.1 hypothetical protein [Acidimicrobiaceae bacterium]MCO5330490.1 alpha-amylase family glycosyl hydrolase [Ilumatobacteraceae bacterium]
MQPAGAAAEVVVDAARDQDGRWVAACDAADGDRYWLLVDDGPPLLDPHCRDVELTADGPRSVFRAPWGPAPQAPALLEPPVVYELHVKGFGGSYLGCIDHLDHVVEVGANVIELLPVHPFEDAENYWGYMPLVWGAVHRGYAAQGERAAEELMALVAAAHERGLHVWLDVVFNHTGDDGLAHPVRSLRGLDERGLYRHHADGRPYNDSGCGNDVDPSHPYVRELVMEGLQRLADLGVDGFRFDLASLLTRDGGGLVDMITAWGDERGLALVSEPWDLGAYQVGHGWPWPTWWQWNDRFRDDIRGFLRGEHGLVHAVRQRVQGSPDLFGPDGPRRSLNFVAAHDGLTMHDLTTVTSDRHHAWDCGPELRMQQLQNYFTMLLLSAGGSMWVMGDEFGRSQQNHDNPYNIDGPLTRVDWAAAGEWHRLTEYVQALQRLRRAHPPGEFRFFGVGPDIDEGFLSHSLAWSSNGLYVMANAWWEPLEFEVQEPGEWRVVLATAVATSSGTGAVRYTLAPRSIVVLQRIGA